jgi:hypothetical protein
MKPRTAPDAGLDRSNIAVPAGKGKRQLLPFAQFYDVTYYGSQLRLPRKTTIGYVRLFLSLFFKARKLELQRLESLLINKSLVKHMTFGSAH